jgi:anti-anti-sigma factor
MIIFSGLRAAWVPVSFAAGSRVSNQPPAELPGFAVTVTAETVTVVLRGEFDVTSAGFLAECLARLPLERPRRLVFAAALVTFIDCASARLIVGTDHLLPPGVKPVIACPSAIVRRVLQASGLSARCVLSG